MFADACFAPLLEKLSPDLPTVEAYVFLTDAAHMPETSLKGAAPYEDLLAGVDGDFAWLEGDENEADRDGAPEGLRGRGDRRAAPEMDERPLLVVVPEPGEPPTREELIAWFEGRIAKWWTPNDVVLVEELPHTAAGKVAKRELLSAYRLPGGG